MRKTCTLILLLISTVILSGQDFDPTSYKIAFLTKEVDSLGVPREQGLIDDLRGRGFDVDMSYNNSTEYEQDFEFSYDTLEGYDLVIIGRGVSSGDFTEAQAWAEVSTPIICFSAYLMRSSRMQWINSGSASREVDSAGLVAMDRVTDMKLADPALPVFTGLDEDADSLIGYHTWFYDYIGYGADSFEVNHDATLLGSLSHDGGPGDGTVVMAMWDTGAEAYPGSDATFAGPRVYLQMGSDDSSDPKVRNFTAFTDESTLLLHNTIKMLLGATPDGMVVPTLSGVVAHYNFDDLTGTVVEDQVGSADGEILNGNGISWVECGVNNALDFSGSTKDDAIIWVNDNAAINFDGDQDFTASILAKIDPHTNTAEMNLLLKGSNSSSGDQLENGNGHYYTIATKDGELRFAVDDDVTKTQLGVAIDETTFPADQWNHIVAVRDRASDSLYLYLNGELFGSALDETEEDISTPALPLVIGNYHSGVRKINGVIDELMLLDSAMSATDISAMYESLSVTDDCTVLETITELSDDATLSALEVSEGELTPAFDAGVTTYSVEVPEGTTSVTITATASDSAATVEGDGEFTDLPGSAVITVTAQDSSTLEYTINFSVEGAGGSRIVVQPDFDALYLAIQEANSGDTLVLVNGGLYIPVTGAYEINKTLVIIADTIPELPGLENMPVIDNQFGVNPIFQLNFGADLTLIGIDVNGGGASNIIDTRGNTGAQIAVYINRCRLHNTIEDIFNDANDANLDETALTRCTVINSFIYDSGGGHGIYVKNYQGSNEPYVFENNTFWNLGQQFNWIRHYGVDDSQTFIYDHNTGYNLSSDEGAGKEIFGNSDGDDEATLTIEMTNNIFHTQIAENEGSLKFNNTSGRHSISLENNVLFEVAPIFDIGGTIEKDGNMEGVDPMFVDPDNGDFTVMNADLYTAATDGEIIGALYWHPDFVDDFSDLTTSTKDQVVPTSEFEMINFPNPFIDKTNVTFTTEVADEVRLDIFDITGKLVKSFEQELRSGTHQIEINGSDLRAGTYLYKLTTNGTTATGRMVKN